MILPPEVKTELDHCFLDILEKPLSEKKKQEDKVHETLLSKYWLNFYDNVFKSIYFAETLKYIYNSWDKSSKFSLVQLLVLIKVIYKTTVYRLLLAIGSFTDLVYVWKWQNIQKHHFSGS